VAKQRVINWMGHGIEIRIDYRIDSGIEEPQLL
jgi:hypothetical protein